MSPTWYPARYVNVEVRSIPLAPQEESAARTEWHCLPLSRKQEEITTTCVNDDYFVDRAFPLFEYMRTITNKDLGSLLHRALAWHTTGNFLGSGLNRFLNYWESIELLAHFFYKRLPRELTARPTKSQKKDKVLDILNQPITRRNCLEIANQCARVVPPMPSARTVMQSTLPIITGQKDFGDVLFEKDPQTDTSLYDIRNDIAHGNRCDHDLEFTELVDARLHEVYSCSRDTLWLAVQRVSDLEKLLEA